MKSPSTFDYDFIKVNKEDYIVRIKRTGEKCSVSDEVLRLLRNEEKRERRYLDKVEEDPMLSLEFIYDEGEEFEESVCLDDKGEERMVKKLDVDDFIWSLTKPQQETVNALIIQGYRRREFARRAGISVARVRERMEEVICKGLRELPYEN